MAVASDVPPIASQQRVLRSGVTGQGAQWELYENLPTLRAEGAAVVGSTTAGPGLALDCCEPLVVTILECGNSVSWGSSCSDVVVSCQLLGPKIC